MLSKIVNKFIDQNSAKINKDLYIEPKREVGINQMPTFQDYEEGVYEQADLLFLPEDKLDDDKDYFWISVSESKVKPAEKVIFKEIKRTFLDTDDKKVYVISDVVKPSKISKVKKGLYFQYYDYNQYKNDAPQNENDYEYTQVDLFLNAKWVKYKSRIKSINYPETKNNKTGYQYALVVVDNHSKKCDAFPLRDKNPDSIIEGFKTIWKRKIIKVPKLLEVDNGNEFKSNVPDYLKSLGIKVRVAITGRHRQQAIVEKRNQLLGTLIHRIQSAIEMKTNQINTKWVELLPQLIKEINENLPTPLDTQPSNFPYSDETNENLIPIGTAVRVQLDHPINAHNEKRLSGKFRSGDIKWNPKESHIKEILLKPSEPPLYLVDTDNVAHTRQQLHFV